MSISVIIPIYNEENVIGACLLSLSLQTREFELIIVDDGSTDKSESIVLHSKLNNSRQITFLKQDHKGPAAARNLGARKASGSILVFVDSDMTFAPTFLDELVKPIEEGKTWGTFTKEELVANWNNIWAKCWNYNQGIVSNHRIPKDYPDTAPVFRAILAQEFRRVDGYTEGIGWTDDWTLSRKLEYKSTVTQALCYHANPATLAEVFLQAHWIGKNEFLTGSLIRIFYNLIRYNIISGFCIGIYKSILYKTWAFLVFKLVYNLAVSISLFESFFGKQKNK